jgi:hypothetical protein
VLARAVSGVVVLPRRHCFLLLVNIVLVNIVSSDLQF